MYWQLQEAKQKFSQVVQRAIDEGPQIVTRHGETVAVVLSAEEYRRLIGDKPDLAAFLLNAPDLGVLERERSGELARDVDL